MIPESVLRYFGAAYARRTVDGLMRSQVAETLAPMFLQRSRPYQQFDQLTALIDNGMLSRATFIQKTPGMLHFYRRLFQTLDEPPRCILEIGVKGGGSTTLWKKIFPDADVIGMDIRTQLWMEDDPAGVTYVRGDQSDPAALRDIALRHGPFDIVIDDGSHVTEHQVISLRALLPHMRPGGLYVVEDTHTSRKPRDHHQRDYGDDLWPELTSLLLDRLRDGVNQSPAPTSDTERLATEIRPYVQEIIVSRSTFAVRIRQLREEKSTL